MNLRCLYVIVFWVLMSNATILFAQLPKYNLHRILEQDGLKTGEIISMAKDRKGYLWICTQTLAQRFDGRQTIRFPFNETVSKVVVDADDNCWVLTRSALYRYSNETMTFVPVPITGATASPNTIFLLQKKVFALISKQLYQFSQDEKRFASTGMQWQGVTRFLGERGKKVFFGNTDSIFVYNTTGQLLSSHHVANYYFACPFSEDEVLVSTRQFETFLLQLSSANITRISFLSPSLKNSLVVTAAVPLNGNDWFLATTSGWFEMNVASRQMTTNVFFSDGSLLANREGTNLMYKDDDGNVYLNRSDGLYVLPIQQPFMQQLRNYRYGQEILSSNDVRNFTEDAEGTIWMATTKGIATLHPQSGILKNILVNDANDDFEFPSYRQVLHHKGDIWIGTSGNGLLCRRANGQLVKPVFLNTTSKLDSVYNRLYVWKLLLLQNGELLAVCGTSSFLIQPETMKARWVFDNPAAVVSRAAAQDASGRIWQGTTTGLFCFDTAFRLLFQLRDSFPDKRIAAFCEWKPGQMLIGTKGLYEVKTINGKPVQFVAKKAIPSTSFIYCMAKDEAGFVWMGTDEGTYRYDPREDKAVFFDLADGAQTQAFNSDGAFISRSGMMYMGGKNGINYFRPSEYRANENILQPELQFARVGDSLLTMNDAAHHFAYNANSLDFLISAPEFLRPFSLRYRYRLAANDEWTDNGNNNRVRIGKLPPGDYKLEVAVSSDGDKWFTSKRNVAFVINKPWWQTTWFRLLCIAVAAIIVWQIMVYRKRKRQRLEQQQTIEYFTYANANNTVDNLMWDIARNCIARLGFEDCVIYLLNEERQALIQKAALGPKSKPPFVIVNPIEIPIGQGITGTAAETGKTILVKDTSKDSRYIVDDERRMSELAVPIIFDGKTIGVIDSEHKRKNFFTAHHQHMLETIASLCADKLVTAQASERVRIAESELQTLNAQMREASFANLRLQMNPHFLFNTLTTIQYLIVSGQVQKASNYLDIFSGFLRSLLNHAEDTVVSLQEELRILKLYVELESICLDETFVWKVNVDETIDAENVQVPFMLLQPFVENAIHHGLLHKVGEKKFCISIAPQNEDTLKCSIEDNGIGREASSAINEKKLRRHLHPSKGLMIVQQRLQLLQLKTGREAGFEMEDLFAGGKVSGTRIHLLIPDYQTEEV
jgi:ligand-binding sensor domain-containing protein/putative methionine-R-sulfoxide reductase with GAF domain